MDDENERSVDVGVLTLMLARVLRCGQDEVVAEDNGEDEQQSQGAIAKVRKMLMALMKKMVMKV